MQVELLDGSRINHGSNHIGGVGVAFPLASALEGLARLPKGEQGVGRGELEGWSYSYNTRMQL